MLGELNRRSERWFPYVLAFFAGTLVGHGWARAGLDRAVRQALGMAPSGPHDRLPEVRELATNVLSLGASAATDPLTGLPNRLGIDRYLAASGAAGPGVAMIDLDHFKRVNDLYGHPVGDIVLTEAASRLRAGLGHQGMVGRWGGEEFLVLAPGVGGANLVQLAEMLRTGLSSGPIVAGEHQITMTCSIGVATPDLEQETIAEAINRADQAVFRAKESRDAVVAAD